MTEPVRLTLDELCARVALALAEGYAGTGNERSRDVPDKRTARYYTTLGLLERPAEMRGRTALYRRKHLLQLVAIKRLQAKGLSLTEVQAELLGKTERQLERVAQLPAGFERQLEPVIVPEREDDRPAVAAPARSRGFWKEPPQAVGAVAAEASPTVAPLQGVALAEGVTLLLSAPRALDEIDLEGLRAAAQPLLGYLERRRLTPK